MEFRWVTSDRQWIRLVQDFFYISAIFNYSRGKFWVLPLCLGITVMNTLRGVWHGMAFFLINKLFQLAVFSHKGSMSGTTQKTHKTEVMGKILVAGKRLNLGVRGPGEKPSWGETRSSATGGSHPGQESWSVSGGEAHIPQYRNWGEPGGVALLGGVQIRWDRGSTHWSGYFWWPVSNGQALLWGKVKPGVALPCHSFYWEARQQFHIPRT